MGGRGVEALNSVEFCSYVVLRSIQFDGILSRATIFREKMLIESTHIHHWEGDAQGDMLVWLKHKHLSSEELNILSQPICSVVKNSDHSLRNTKLKSMETTEHTLDNCWSITLHSSCNMTHSHTHFMFKLLVQLLASGKHHPGSIHIFISVLHLVLFTIPFSVTLYFRFQHSCFLSQICLDL